ncbi:SDR family oxidoreductase [Ideonella azotifigens]|uniref:SDR family oxidoreductase n=1 Tax=Ideonella azotifigens TaxID=513160 RepID=UPI0011449879|nr:SDR family oxidoreductase [Ideonella azotifigens]MCD2340053.1 SDR family oxidoreductase [Ideonella azotifigens]
MPSSLAPSPASIPPPVLLVTGGGRGIGAAVALAAAAAGHAVAVNYHRDEDSAQKVVERIAAAGGKAIALQADVSQEEQVLRMFAAVDETLGRLNGLVNNAGMLAPQMRVEHMTAARLQQVLATNVIGSFLCAREAVRRMARSHGGAGGAIVNLSSMAAKLGAPGEYVDYAASKGAVEALTIGLAKEIAAEGIRVNGVRPGLIHTDIHASGGEPGRVQRLEASVPMGRGGQPEEVAAAVLWLLSDAASYCTGTFIDVSGGR